MKIEGQFTQKMQKERRKTRKKEEKRWNETTTKTGEQEGHQDNDSKQDGPGNGSYVSIAKGRIKGKPSACWPRHRESTFRPLTKK